jgi:hypothetical protein
MRLRNISLGMLLYGATSRVLFMTPSVARQSFSQRITGPKIASRVSHANAQSVLLVERKSYSLRRAHKLTNVLFG